MPTDELENEQSYENLLLGEHTLALNHDEVGTCVCCLKDIGYVDDYVTNMIFIKSGSSGKTHTEHYHLECYNVIILGSANLSKSFKTLNKTMSNDKC